MLINLFQMGVTEEQMLRHLGAATTLKPQAAATLLEDEGVGFAYLSQREVQPSAYSLNDMRLHIKKRPPFATTEKVQRFVKVGTDQMRRTGLDCIVLIVFWTLRQI
jgi:hypothetical protein